MICEATVGPCISPISPLYLIYISPYQRDLRGHRRPSARHHLFERDVARDRRADARDEQPLEGLRLGLGLGLGLEP